MAAGYRYPNGSAPGRGGLSERSEPGGVGVGTNKVRERATAQLANHKLTPYKA